MESIDFDRAVVSLLVDLANMKKAYDLGLRKYHIVGIHEQDIYEFQYKYWTDSGRKQVASPEVIFTEFKYVVNEVDYTIQYVVEHLKERFRKNAIQDTVIAVGKLQREDAKAAARKMFEDAALVLKYTETRVNKTDMSQSIDQRRLRYDKRANFDGAVRGAPLGFKEVDEHTNGIQGGQVAVVAGYAKAGKSLILAQSFIAAKRAGFNPYVATLELSTAEFEDRIDAINAGVSLKGLLRGTLDKDELRRLHEAQEEFAQYGPSMLEKLDEGDRTVKFICNRAREMDADYLIIDQLSHLETNKPTRNLSDTDRFNIIMNEITVNVSEHEDEMLPVLLAVQFNRESKKQKAGDIGMQHIAGSAAVERYATIIYGLERTKEMEMNNVMNLHILGSRHSDPNSWMLNWKLREKTEFGVLGELGSIL